MIPASELPIDECDRLKTLVLERVGRRVRDFQVQVADEGIVLHGRVVSFYLKQLVLHAVMEATHLPIVGNDILVS